MTLNVCEHCGKGAVVGRSQQHSRGIAGRRWKKRAQVTRRVFQANLQWTTIEEQGELVRKKLCAKCIKRYKFDRAQALLA